MEHEAIAQALGRAGHNWTTAAAAIGRSRTTLVRVSQRQVTSRYVARALCALLGLEPCEVFPDQPRYAVDPEEQKRRLIEEGARRVEAALGGEERRQAERRKGERRAA